MVLYKSTNKYKYTERPSRTMSFEIEEMPERPKYIFRNNKDRYKFCNMVKSIVRKSPEYRDYITFLKKHMHMDKCVVFNNLNIDGTKRYSIELHHTPFTLMEIINVVVSKRQSLGENLNPFMVAEEVMELHYDNKVGLINLSVTAHELAEKGRIFIPLQFIYQRYDKFVDEYEEYMDDNLINKIKIIMQMSTQNDKIVSDVMDTEFVYMNIDGFDLPVVPDEWKDLLDKVNIDNYMSKDE